jgi:hypothetical protein
VDHQSVGTLGRFYIHPVKARMAIEGGYIPTICTCGQGFVFALRKNRKAFERFKNYVKDHLEEEAVIDDYVTNYRGLYVRRGTMDDDTIPKKP